MAKGYWVVNLEISDFATYMEYVGFVNPFLERHGGRFIIRAGQQEVVEGAMHPRVVVIEFPSHAEALAAYNAPDYQEARQKRLKSSIGNFAIVEGFDG